VEEAGDGGPGLFDGATGVLALLVDGAGVAEVLHPVGAHGFEDFGQEGGGRVCVHVDTAHGSILACGRNADASGQESIPQGLKPLYFLRSGETQG